MNKNFKNYANIDTIEPKESWKNYSEENRRNLIKQHLQEFEGAESFEVVQADINGQIIIAIKNGIPANERGLYLLSLEKSLKESIDQGLHLWCEPVGDKSVLRKLRGVEIKT